jgi:hypothetical protein
MVLCTFQPSKGLLELENHSNKHSLIGEFVGKENLLESEGLLSPNPLVKWKTISYSISLFLSLSLFLHFSLLFVHLLCSTRRTIK